MNLVYIVLDIVVGLMDLVVSIFNGEGFAYPIFEGMLAKEGKLIQSKYKGLVKISPMREMIFIETEGRTILIEFDLGKGTAQLVIYIKGGISGSCRGPSIILHDVPKIYNKRGLSKYLHNLFNDISSLLINGAVCDSSKRIIETINNGVTYVDREIGIKFDVKGDKVTIKIMDDRNLDIVGTVIKPKSWVSSSNIRDFVDTYNKQLDFWDQYDGELSKVMYDLDDKFSRLQGDVLAKIRGM